MKKIRMAILAATVAAFTVFPAVTPEAQATHRCGLEDVDPLVNAICEAHPSDYKQLIGIVICLVSPTC